MIAPLLLLIPLHDIIEGFDDKVLLFAQLWHRQRLHCLLLRSLFCLSRLVVRGYFGLNLAHELGVLDEGVARALREEDLAEILPRVHAVLDREVAEVACLWG